MLQELKLPKTSFPIIASPQIALILEEIKAERWGGLNFEGNRKESQSYRVFGVQYYAFVVIRQDVTKTGSCDSTTGE